MKLKEIYKMILNKLNLKEGDKQTESVIKSAINQAYICFAEKDCIIKEHEYLVSNKVLDLPTDFLIFHSLYITVVNYDLSESTFKIPRHYIEVKTNKMLLRDDLFVECTIKSINLIYGSKPTELVGDADIPLIKATYHQGLLYYALFLMTDDTKYYELYMSIYNSIPIDTYVADYTDIVDVL